jgi:dihydroneopterin aldolase
VNEVKRDPVNLLETVAARVASAVLADKRIDAVEVTIHKPQAPIETAFSDVSVTIRRTAADLA